MPHWEDRWYLFKGTWSQNLIPTQGTYILWEYVLLGQLQYAISYTKLMLSVLPSELYMTHYDRNIE